MATLTAPTHLTVCSPAWYAWHADHPVESRYSRVMGAVMNTVIGALMATVGYGAAGEVSPVEQDATTGEDVEQAAPVRARVTVWRVLLAVVVPVLLCGAMAAPYVAHSAPTVATVAYVSPAATVGAVCSSDADCDAYDRAAAAGEDDPRWDCRTMGNLLCGPSSPWGPYSLPVGYASDYLVCPDGGALLDDTAGPSGAMLCDYAPRGAAR